MGFEDFNNVIEDQEINYTIFVASRSANLESIRIVSLFNQQEELRV